MYTVTLAFHLDTQEQTWKMFDRTVDGYTEARYAIAELPSELIVRIYDGPNVIYAARTGH